MGKTIGNHFENLTKDTKEAINNSLEYYKLDLLKKTATSLISGGQFIIRFGIVALILFFVSLGLSFLIGNNLGSVSYGFFIMGGFYLILLILFSIFGRKLLERPILNFLSKVLSSEDDSNVGLESENDNNEAS